MNFIDSLTEALFGGAAQASPMGLGAPPALAAQPRAAAPAGDMPTLANALGSILRGSGAVPQTAKPSIAPQPVPMSPPSMPPQVSAAPAAKTGLTGEGVASFIRSVMEGAAGVKPSSPGISAFAQGGAGAFGSRDRVKAKEDAAKIAAADRKMKLEDRELAIDDKAFDRSLKTSAEKRAISKDSRDAKTAEIGLVKTMSEVMRNVDPQLDIKDRIAVERLVRDEGKRLGTEGLAGDELKTKMQEYSKDLQSRLLAKKPSVTGPLPGLPGTGALQAAPKPAAGNGKSQASPAAPTDQATFDALPSGSWFVNPADGRILQKQ